MTTRIGDHKVPKIVYSGDARGSGRRHYTCKGRERAGDLLIATALVVLALGLL
ncbi:MAG TPA: hypothetical protein VE194_02940 [Rubrobacter sp.]|nr:hypothetical protein [Rubrobacter sp.]